MLNLDQENILELLEASIGLRFLRVDWALLDDTSKLFDSCVILTARYALDLF